MKANLGKCHVILSSSTRGQINNTSIASNLSEKLLGIILDSEVKFEEQTYKI